MPNGTDERLLTIRQQVVTDTSGTKRAIADVKSLEKASANLQVTMLKEGKSASEIAKAMAAYHQRQQTAADATARTDARVAALRARLEALKMALDGVEAQTQRSTYGFLEEAEAVEKETDAIREQTEALRQRTDAVETAGKLPFSLGDLRAARPVPSTGANRAGLAENVDRVGSVGSQILSGLGQGEAANAAGLLGDVAGAFTSLNPVMLAVTAASVAAAAVFGDMQKRIEAFNEVATAFAERAVANAELIASGATTDDVTEQRDRLRQVFDILSGQAGELGGIAEEMRQFVVAGHVFTDLRNTSLQPFLDKVTELTGVTVTNFNDVQTLVNSLSARTNEYGETLLNLNQLLLSGDLAFNDAAAAAEVAAEGIDRQREANERLVEVLGGAADSILDRVQEAFRAQTEAQAAAIASDLAFRQRAVELRRSAGVEQLNALQQQMQEEFLLNAERIRQLDQLPPVSAAVNRELKTLRDRQAELASQTALLADEVRPVVELREREASAAAALTENISQQLKALEAEGVARQKLFDAQTALNDLNSDSVAKLDEIRADAEIKRGELESRALGEQLENASKANKDREKLEREHRDRLFEINRAADFTLSDALRRRDVTAAITAIRAREEEKRKENKEYEQRLDDLDERMKEQNDVVQGRLDEQLKNIRDNADKAVRAEEARANKERATRQRAIDQAQVDLQNAQNAQRLLQQQHYANLNSQTQSGMLTLINTFGEGLITMVGQVKAAFQRISVPQAPRQYSSPIGPQPAGSASNLNNIPFQFLSQGSASSRGITQFPSQQQITNLTLNAPDSTRRIENVSREQAIRAVREIWEF